MTIRLTDMAFFAHHGVLAEEKQNGNDFLVSLSLQMPDTLGVQTDCVSDTVNYEQVYRIVRDEMQIPSDLLENVAGRIRDALCREWPAAHAVVRVSKKNPPVGGPVAWASVEVESK